MGALTTPTQSSAPPASRARIEQLKRLVQQGRYNPDPNHVAEALIRASQAPPPKEGPRKDHPQDDT